MDKESINTIIGLIFTLVFFFGFFIIIFIGIKIENNHELKKLGIVKPNNKAVKIQADYNEKIKYQIKFWLINIIALLIVCGIATIFGFGVKDVIKMFT